MSQTKISKAGIAFFSSLCASTFALGSWQTQRYFEKVDLMDRRETDLRKEPIPYEKHRQDPESFRRIKLHGSFDHDREIYIGPRGPPAGALALSGPNSGRGGGLSSSPQGYFVITPFVLSSDSNTTILVNRGWVPRNFVLPPPSQQVTLVDTWDRPHGIVDIVGVSSRAEEPRFLKPPAVDKRNPKVLLWMDVEAIKEKTRIETESTLPILIETELTEDIQEGPSIPHYPIKPSTQTVGEYKVTPAIHAGYAVTWFGLFGAGVIMTRKLITKGR